jgi:DNA-binding transcriptional ArsR family regulator
MSSLFKVLGSEKRRMMLKLLKRQEMHISGIARELGISVPVALKHIKKLEDAGLVVRRRVGNTHLIKIPEDRMERLSSIWKLLDEPLVLEARKGASLADVLGTMPEIDIKNTKQGCYINAVDGREGYFVYEVDGRLTDKPINRYKVAGDMELEIKRLLPALDKKIRIKVK